MKRKNIARLIANIATRTKIIMCTLLIIAAMMSGCVEPDVKESTTVMWKDGAIVEPTIVPIATLTPSATDVIVTINDIKLGWRCDTFEQSDYHVKAIYDKPDSGMLRVEVFVFPNNAHAHDAFVGALSVEENVFANVSMNIGNESYITEYDDDTLGLFRYKNVLCLTHYKTTSLLKFSEIDTVKKYSKLMYDKIDNQSQKRILIPTSATTPTPVTPTPEPTPDQPKLGSYENPVPMGEAFLSNTGALRITMLEVERGTATRNAIRVANMFNDDPQQGNEYLFVKIRFEYLEGDSEFYLSCVDFDAYANNVECNDPFVVMPDNRPEMESVTMMPGGTVEKWKCFEVPNGARVTIAYDRLFAPTYYFDVGD